MPDTTTPRPPGPGAPAGRGDAAAAPRWPWALAAGSSVFALYALTLAPTTQLWDTSEYIATAHILGIPHPPGNPLFVVLARAWDALLAPLGLSVAVRINLFSALMSAGAHALWFCVMHEVLGHFSRDRAFRLVGAFGAVLVSATAFTVWNQSNVNEKVYTVSLLTIALLTWLAFRWRERLGRGGEGKVLVLMAFVLALSVGNHLMAFLAAPAILVFVLAVRPRALLDWRLVPAVVAAAVAGLSIHLYLPLRAALEPVINQADPRCESLAGALTSVVTYGKAGCVALSEAIARQQYVGPEGTPGPGTLARQSPVLSQLVMYLQYFDWQWARSVQGGDPLFAGLRAPFTLLFGGLGAWGALRHARRDRPSFLFFLVLFATLSLGLVLYLNFEPGFSFAGGQGEVRERDYFFVAGFSVWGLWAGLGIAALWRRLADEVTGSLVRAAPVLGLALLPLILNASWASRADDWSARDYAYNLLMSVEPYGVLFTHGDNDTFPLWYLQEVEGLRRDVTVVVGTYLNTPWYAKQLRDLTRPCPPDVAATDDPTRILCQRPYDAGPRTRAVYTDRPDVVPEGTVAVALRGPVRAPESPILSLDDGAIDRVAESWVALETDRVLQFGQVRARLEAGQVLMPRHQLGLYIINDSLGERPIHFSAGTDAAELGLARHLVRQGLSYRLHDGELPATALPGYAPMPPEWPVTAVTGPWVDVPRTRTLMDDVFVHRGGIPDWDHWKDRPSIGIPNYYAWGYLALAQAALQAGATEASERYRLEAERWLQLGS